MRYIVLGGGCYGTFYARQLLRARDAGALAVDEIVVVDRNAAPRARLELGEAPPLRFEATTWEAFVADYFAKLPPDADDRLVPPPFTPHLALAWLLDRARDARPRLEWTLEPFRALPAIPFAQQAEGGPLVVSHADWICPVHCIEPATCPKTRGPRHWDMDRTARELAQELDARGQPVDQVHLFHCRHEAYGVGAYPSALVPAALRSILGYVDEGGEGGGRFLVGTISHCHGALHLLCAAAILA